MDANLGWNGTRIDTTVLRETSPPEGRYQQPKLGNTRKRFQIVVEGPMQETGLSLRIFTVYRSSMNEQPRLTPGKVVPAIAR